jgi:hypothetical protein
MSAIASAKMEEMINESQDVRAALTVGGADGVGLRVLVFIHRADGAGTQAHNTHTHIRTHTRLGLTHQQMRPTDW